jgi:tetratricopeptide (TPR) repeat protein
LIAQTYLALSDVHQIAAPFASSYDELMQLGAQQLHSNNLIFASETYEAALLRANEIGDKIKIAAALHNIGVAYGMRGDLAHSQEVLGKALKLYDEKKNAKGMADVYGALGIVYRRQADTVHAIESYRAALSLLEQTGNKESMALTASNLGIVYAQANDVPHAEEMFLRSVKYSEQTGSKQSLAVAHRNLGEFYLHQGSQTKACAHWMSARKLLVELRARQPAQSLNDSMARAKCPEN